MYALSTKYGMVLVFSNKEDMKAHTQNLQGFLEYIESPETPKRSKRPPHLYAVYDDAKFPGKDVARKHLRELKKKLQKKGGQDG